MKTETNPKGAGRKKLPFKTKTMRVPLALESEFKKRIEEWRNNHV